jgi:hypothetical protein
MHSVSDLVVILTSVFFIDGKKDCDVISIDLIISSILRSIISMTAMPMLLKQIPSSQLNWRSL